jgi:hypothetical protein
MTTETQLFAAVELVYHETLQCEEDGHPKHVFGTGTDSLGIPHYGDATHYLHLEGHGNCQRTQIEAVCAGVIAWVIRNRFNYFTCVTCKRETQLANYATILGRIADIRR